MDNFVDNSIDRQQLPTYTIGGVAVLVTNRTLLMMYDVPKESYLKSIGIVQIDCERMA